MKIAHGVEKFMREHGMHPDCIVFEEFAKAFAGEMEAGLDGRPSSLKMIPAYIGLGGDTPEGVATAVDIGGSRLRLALVRHGPGGPEVLESEVHPVPGLKGKIPKDRFFGEIAQRLRPFAQRSDRIGVCFSHAAEILPDGEGKVISMSKEIQVDGIEGAKICAELRERLDELGCGQGKRLFALNDTAAALLGGISAFGSSPSAGWIGLVLGTGMNICYPERTSRIRKLRAPWPESDMLVNTEAGCFDKWPRGSLDAELDLTTEQPGDHLLEKAVGGRYFGRLAAVALRAAAIEGLLPASDKRRLLGVDELTMSEIGAMLSGAEGGEGEAEGANAARFILDALVERASKLTAAAVAAAAEFASSSGDADKQPFVVAEGSTFHKLLSFSERFQRYLAGISPAANRRFRLVSAENLTLLGASYAALRK